MLLVLGNFAYLCSKLSGHSRADMYYDYTDPTPAPFPSEARPFPLTRLPVAIPVAFPLQGRGVPADREVQRCEDKLCEDKLCEDKLCEDNSAR